MTEAFFFKRGSGLTLREIVALTGATPRRDPNLDQRITSIAPLDRALSADLVFFDSAKYAVQMAASAAGACLTSERFADRVPEHVALLCVGEPYRAFIEVARALFPQALHPSSLFEISGTAPGAIVHSTARVENGITIDPGAVIGPRAEIGSGTLIGAGAVIGPNVHIGRDCAIGANASISHALIGDRVIIHSGCLIGQDGFGFVMGPHHRKAPQIGRVIIQDDVEIGAGTAVDRGGLRDTVIGEGSKIDNLVQIGHNVSIGRHCIIVSQCGISGSVVLGDYVVLAGGVGLADNIKIGEGAVIGAGSGVIGDVPAGEKWLGYPAMRGRDFLRSIGALRQIAARDIKGPAKGGKPADTSRSPGRAPGGKG
jgi:UDP-3-O-[3-hydroxymyristoyl] glucosamine N-acyltransferase